MQMRIQKIKDKIADIFFGTIIFPITMTLIAVFFLVAVFHPTVRFIAHIIILFIFHRPYLMSDTTVIIISVIIAALASVLSFFSWKGCIYYRNLKVRDKLVRKIIELERPHIDFDGADNRDVFRVYDSHGRLQRRSVRKLKEQVKQLKETT